jgi:adenosylmethionine-8-amino-7-oxononanoate aminotransferase
MVTKKGEDIRELALDYYGIHPRDWQTEGTPGNYMVWVSGKGSRVTDSNGKSYIDGFAGLMYKNIGYGRHEIADVAYEQMKKLTSLPSSSPSGISEPQALLSEKLAQIAPGSLSKTTYTSGGSESVETAVKIARAYHKLNGEPSRYKLISRRGTYHGYTMLTMSLAAHGPMTAMYEPLAYGVYQVSNVKCYRCDFNLTYPSCNMECARELERTILAESPNTVAAVVMDPVSHSDICTPPKPEYWSIIRSTCDKYGVLLISDEVVTAFGRTGKMFGVENWDYVPDIMAVAKGITSGYLPLGAVMVKNEVAEKFGAGFMHIITFGGLPAPCAAALKNIEIIEQEKLAENAAKVGAHLLDQLKALMDRHVSIGEVRGIGLMTQTELVANRETREPLPREVTGELRRRVQDNGLIARIRSGMISLFPPLTTTKEEMDEAVGIMDKTLTEMEKDGKLPK